MTRRHAALLALALLLQAAAAALLWRGTYAAALILHAAGAAAWGFGAYPLLPGNTRRDAWHPAAWALLFPVAGPLVFLAFAAELRRPTVDRSTRRYLVWNDHLKDDWAPPPTGSAGLSIVEILQSPETRLRRNAILALRELDPQLAIPLLRKGLQDSDEQVRIYAQNILSAMLERFEAGIKELEERIAAGEFDPLTATRLAEQYFELVYLDVAGDDETAAHYLAKALGLLERAALASPQDGAVAFLGFKFSLRARDAAAARRWLARLEQVSADVRPLLPWRLELAFLEADWPRLLALFAEFRAAGEINPRIEELAAFWLDRPAPAADPAAA